MSTKDKYAISSQKHHSLRLKQHRYDNCIIIARPNTTFTFRCWSRPSLDIYFDFDIRDCCKKHNIEPPSWPYDIALVLTDLSKYGLFSDYHKFKEEFGFLFPI